MRRPPPSKRELQAAREFEQYGAAVQESAKDPLIRDLLRTITQWVKPTPKDFVVLTPARLRRSRLPDGTSISSSVETAPHARGKRRTQPEMVSTAAVVLDEVPFALTTLHPGATATPERVLPISNALSGLRAKRSTSHWFELSNSIEHRLF
jgi:hypothetical protein